MTKYTECWARDGIQADVAITTEAKLAVLSALGQTGVQRVEVTSFASPSHWPQFADADQVVDRYARAAEIEYSAYVPNERGYGRLAATGTGAGRRLDVVLVAVATSDSYNRKNVGMDLRSSIAEVKNVIGLARGDGFGVVGCVGTAWACPIEGAMPVEHVLGIAAELLAAGATEVMFGDTTGEANPTTSAELLGRARSQLNAPVSAHFHDARGTAIVNAVAAVQVGVDRIEGSLGGVGGHPPDDTQHAPSGNLCTEDFLVMSKAAGLHFSVDLDAVLHAGLVAQTAMGRALRSNVQRAGLPESLNRP